MNVKKEKEMGMDQGREGRKGVGGRRRKRRARKVRGWGVEGGSWEGVVAQLGTGGKEWLCPTPGPPVPAPETVPRGYSIPKALRTWHPYALRTTNCTPGAPKCS